MRSRGFSLLEVLMAVALFGAVVTTILAAQAGLVSGNRTAANMSQAVALGRCRMSELEEKQLKLGFPLVEDKDSSPLCCDAKEVPGFSCDWQVERVTLPQVASFDGGAGSALGGGLDLDAGMLGTGTSLPSAVSGALGTVVNNPLGSAQLDLDAGLQNIGQTLQQSFGGGGAQGLLSMAFSIVYPSLRPLLESAIRRITVKVHWKEGSTDRDFTLTQYVTNPSQAGLLSSMPDAGAVGEGGLPALFGLPTGAAGPGTPTPGLPGGR
jgi:general secretion pathway protein I